MRPPPDLPASVLPPAVAADADWLRANVADFRAISSPHGRASLAPRPSGFPALVRHILEQQVSTKAAAAMWAKLAARVDGVTPEALMALDEAALKACGFSRQKTRYVRALAEAVLDGSFDLAAVAADPDDEAAIAALTVLPGIGRWTAENYLLWSLGRRDILPAGDLALLVAWQWLSGAAARPKPDELRALAEAWRPRRSAATFLLWHFYLDTTERPAPPPK
ncbi:MAG: DNA-3-methyladenine glycosylase 2 family protein [Rhodospirillaceae bacterium]|nr:DNA-3-methyladenine glycosylase 2 family protein [Rhodospirillaceae bacterium]